MSNNFWGNGSKLLKHFPQQGPINSEQENATITQEEPDAQERDEKRMMMNHSHAGHTATHPLTIRHRKQSADPLHGEEDKLIDEFRELFERAQRGEASMLEMSRVRDIKGRLDEIQCSRESDARRILGDNLEGEIGDEEGPRKISTSAIVHNTRPTFDQKPVS